MITTQTLLDMVKAAAADEGGYETVVWEAGSIEPNVPGAFVLFTPSNGTGLQTEWVTDVRGLDVLVAGHQNDFGGAESLAYFVDRILLGGGGSRQIGAERVVDMNRFGSAPYNSEQDDADRHHFVASYLYEVDSGLALH